MIWSKANKRKLYRDIEEPLDKYGTVGLGSMGLSQVLENLTDVMKANRISMPSTLTMLARGLATIEGIIAALSPELNVIQRIPFCRRHLLCEHHMFSFRGSPTGLDAVRQ